MNGSMAQYEIRELNPTVRGHPTSYYPHDHPYARRSVVGINPFGDPIYDQRGGVGIEERGEGYIPPLFMEDGGTSPSKKNTYHIPMPPTPEAQTNGGSAWGGVAAALAPEQGYDGSLYGDLYTVPVAWGNFSADPYDRSSDWSISVGVLGDPTQGPYDHLDDRIRRDDDGPPGSSVRFFRIEAGF